MYLFSSLLNRHFGMERNVGFLSNYVLLGDISLATLVMVVLVVRAPACCSALCKRAGPALLLPR